MGAATLQVKGREGFSGGAGEGQGCPEMHTAWVNPPYAPKCTVSILQAHTCTLFAHPPSLRLAGRS